MRFLVDAQLPPALARWLAGRGHQVTACIPISGEPQYVGSFTRFPYRV